MHKSAWLCLLHPENGTDFTLSALCNSKNILLADRLDRFTDDYPKSTEINFPNMRRSHGYILILRGVVAIRQSWLAQHSSSLECGMSSEEKFLNALPFAKWWPDMFEANGDCADVTWKLISLTIPDWSILCFTGLCLMAIYTLLSNRNQS